MIDNLLFSSRDYPFWFSSRVSEWVFQSPLSILVRKFSGKPQLKEIYKVNPFSVSPKSYLSMHREARQIFLSTIPRGL